MDGVWMAKTEEVRFELTRPLRAYRFSRPAHSATLALLRDGCETIADAGEPVKTSVFSAFSEGFCVLVESSIPTGLSSPCDRRSPLPPSKCAKKRAKRRSAVLAGAPSVPVAA